MGTEAGYENYTDEDLKNKNASNKPDPSTFGANGLANRAARPVGQNPQQQPTTPGAAGPPVAGGTTQTPNGSTIGQSPMNPSMNLSAGQSNTPTQTLNYATRPGTGQTDFNAINKPDPATFGANGLANRAARPVGRSMADPQRQAEMARRDAVANSGQQAAEPPDETGLQARAKGGPVQAGRPYLVGEKGPEIIVPKHSGTVVPNHALKPARQTRGLFMQPRPVPAAFFQQMTRALRGRGR
jgi:hypothetical protein